MNKFFADGIKSPITGACFAILAFVLAGCATPRQETLVVVVPERDGKVGTVAMKAPEGEAVMHTAYASARTRAGGPPQTSTMEAEEFKTRFSASLAARPEPPISFTLNFLGDSDELTPQSMQQLPGILAELRRRSVAEIVVVGHTDRVGKTDYNDRLSLQRAQRMVSELEKIGIPISVIIASGRGEREPLVATEDEVPEPRNRRVEVSVR